MKISKRSAVQACVCEENVCEDMTCATPACPYQAAVDAILVAIESLGAVAKEDPIARESIANLSVVLFDLKS